MQLFCIPFAGGSATVYSKWKGRLGGKIEIVPLELSGRGDRFGEPLYNDFQAAVGDLYDLILKNMHEDQPYAIFGHSMGALLAYELYVKLALNQNALPVHMFFSGREAPHINLFETNKIKISNLPDNQFLEELKKYNGVTAEFLENQELVNLFLPVIRSDFHIVENYVCKHNHVKLHCPITVLNGTEDYTTEANVNEWKSYTNHPCEIVNVDGGHFFIENQLDVVLEQIQSTLEKAEVKSLV
ncbi:thioesterase domain-containing protein [Mesobacillus foraminis]|uniref:thioesterase II family protein n=1 Tax=Mesobacillus foraminis TaxID=279826 RepID=UPI0039A132B2